MSESGSNRRQRAAAAREAANAGEKRRERTVRIVGAVTVLVIVAAIIGLAVYARNAGGTQPGELVTATPDPTAPAPKGVLPAGDEHEFGVVYGQAKEGAPTLVVWEDFQCPACGKVEEANGEGIAALAESGAVRLIWRPTTFLDKNLQNDASLRAVAAWGCAIDAGKAREYHDIVFANQPTKEGDGYTREQLIAFAGDSGISGEAATAFEQCVDAGTYLTWAANSTQVFYDANHPGTPYALLNGQEVGLDVLSDKAKLDAAVASVAKQ